MKRLPAVVLAALLALAAGGYYVSAPQQVEKIWNRTMAERP